jgi:2-polyprenyl-3-methyl-5-hydroxy-6-metoxy-1,4-benzoquinol methylase
MQEHPFDKPIWDGRNFDTEAAALPVLQFDLLMHNYMLKTFAPWLQDGNVLELGAFHGDFTARLLVHSRDLTVVEASQECADIVRNRFAGIEVINSPLEKADPGRKFRNIFLIHTLEHLEYPVAALKRCAEWLADDGRLFVAVPNAFAASRQIAVGMGLLDSAQAVMPAEAAHGHKRTYDRRALMTHANQANLNILESGGIMFKALAGAQIDRAMAAGIIDNAYLDGSYEMGKKFPDLCNSVYVVCGR